jgi:hypothetical protein
MGSKPQQEFLTLRSALNYDIADGSGGPSDQG